MANSSENEAFLRELGSRRMTGADLLQAKELLGIGTADMLFVTGLSMPEWSSLTREETGRSGEPRSPNRTEPLRDPALCMLVKAYLEEPTRVPMPRQGNPIELYDLLEEYIDVNKGDFGLILGREPTSGYRWMKPDSAVPAMINRYIRIIVKDIEGAVSCAGSETEASEAVQKIWGKWVASASREARVRGINLEKDETWRK